MTNDAEIIKIEKEIKELRKEKETYYDFGSPVYKEVCDQVDLLQLKLEETKKEEEI